MYRYGGGGESVTAVREELMPLYRKEYDTAEEARQAAKGFDLIDNIDRPGKTPAVVEGAAVIIELSRDITEYAGFDLTGWERIG